MIAVATDCSVVMGDVHHRVVISTVAVPIIGPSVCVSGEWVEACSSDADGYVSSSNDIDLSGLVSPLSDATSAFLIIFIV